MTINLYGEYWIWIPYEEVVVGMAWMIYNKKPEGKEPGGKSHFYFRQTVMYYVQVKFITMNC